MKRDSSVRGSKLIFVTTVTTRKFKWVVEERNEKGERGGAERSEAVVRFYLVRFDSITSSVRSISPSRNPWWTGGVVRVFPISRNLPAPGLIPQLGRKNPFLARTFEFASTLLSSRCTIACHEERKVRRWDP